MTIATSNLSFFVKVEGRAHSNHRNPEGIYGVKVVAERTPKHSACAALNVARDSVPFLNENPDAYILRVFTDEGDEVRIASSLNTAHEAHGLYTGRSKNPPESIVYN